MAKIAFTASAASSSVRKVAVMVRTASGLGTTLITALVITPSVPSDPTNSSVRLYPTTSLMHLEPVRTTSPVGSTTSSPMT